MRYAIGLDIGGTTIKGGLVDQDGSIAVSVSASTPRDEAECLTRLTELARLLAGAATDPAEDPATSRDTAAEDATSCAAASPGDASRDNAAEGDAPTLTWHCQPGDLAGAEILDGIGLDAPGIVSDQDGTVEWSANLGWRDFTIRDRLAQRLGKPVYFGHDVRSGALAEGYWGAAHPNFFYIAIGTGIATVLVLNSAPVATGGWIGELGQIIVPGWDGEPTTLERVSAASAISRRGAILGLIEPHQGAADVYRLADAGDQRAKEVTARAERALAHALAPIITAVGPIPIVLGGGLANRGNALFDSLTEHLRAELGEVPVPAIEGAQLGSQSQVKGAALRVFQANV